MIEASVVLLAVSLLAVLVLVMQHRALNEEVERLRVLVDKVRLSASTSCEDVLEALANLESEEVARLTWIPTGTSYPLYAGMSVLQAMQLQGLPVASACGGRLQCGQCKISVGGNGTLPEPCETESMYLADNSGKFRLACALSNTKDLEIGPKELPAL